MYKKLLIISSLLLAGCTADPMTEPSGENTENKSSHKIINTSVNAVEKSLIVYFDDQAVEILEETATRAAAIDAAVTRSGIVPVDEVLNGLSVSSIGRLFPYDARSEERTRAAGLHKWYLLTFADKININKAAADLAVIADVSRIQFDTKLKKASTGTPHPYKGNLDDAASTRSGQFNDPGLSKQWHYINTGDKGISSTIREGADINVQEAWKLTAGDPSIIVAIVDEGVKYTHPDLAANMWTNPNPTKGDIHGYNFATNSSTLTWSKEAWDGNEYIGDSGHGTHVAGTVAAVNNNGKGGCGIAGGTGSNDGVKLMSCQIFSGDKGGTVSVSAQAIKYATDNGASILQCSWGYNSGYMTSDNQYNSRASAEKQAIDYFINNAKNEVVDGGIVIFAAGNETGAMAGYPAAYNKYIAVTSFSPDFLPAYYTNYGSGCNIAAPGGDYYISATNPDETYYSAEVLSTLPSELYGTDYGTMQGTSMACPHVSGIAALGLSYALAKGKQYTLDEFNSMLLTSVNDIDTYLDGTKRGPQGTMVLSNYRKKMGTGAIDTYQLLMQIEGTPCLKAQVGTPQVLSLDKFFGGSSSNLTYLSVEISQEDMAKLGISATPTFSYGKLQLTCTKPGTARIKIKAVAGGTSVGGGSTIGGKEISKEFAIIARSVQTANGGWL